MAYHLLLRASINPSNGTETKSRPPLTFAGLKGWWQDGASASNSSVQYSKHHSWQSRECPGTFDGIM